MKKLIRLNGLLALAVLLAGLTLPPAAPRALAQDPTLEAAIFQATARARATHQAWQATRTTVRQTAEALAAQHTAEALAVTRSAAATRQALDTQARQQALVLTGAAQVHHESSQATATAAAFKAHQQQLSATATMQALHTLAVQQTLDAQAAANVGVLLLSGAIAAMLVLIGLGVYKFFKARATPAAGSALGPADTDDAPRQTPRTVVVDASQPGRAQDMARAIAAVLGDRLPDDPDGVFFGEG